MLWCVLVLIQKSNFQSFQLEIQQEYKPKGGTPTGEVRPLVPNRALAHVQCIESYRYIITFITYFFSFIKLMADIVL